MTKIYFFWNFIFEKLNDKANFQLPSNFVYINCTKNPGVLIFFRESLAE